MRAESVDFDGERLLERREALDTVLGAVEDVTRGAGGVMFVVGSAGLGKSSVIDVARRAAARAGLPVGSGVGSPMESGLPFGLLGQAILALGGSDEDDPVALDAAAGDQWAGLYRMFRWLTNFAADAGLVLAFDDLQWADPDSLQLLGFLCRRLQDARILVLGGLRQEPDLAWELARELVGAGHAKMVSLEPLSAEAAASLLEGRLTETVDPQETERVVSACAGNPLLLESAAISLRSGNSMTRFGHERAIEVSLLLERFVGVGREALTYAHAAAVLGVRFRPALGGAVAGLEPNAWQSAHGRLLRAGLLDDLGGGWARFAHPLFAESLLRSQPLWERERAHARAFTLLVEQHAADALAADHAHAAGLIGDALAVEVTARAGREADRQGAKQAACVHFAHAVELAGDVVDPGLLIDHASALVAVVRLDEAEEICGRVLSISHLDPAVRARSLEVLATAAALTGRPAAVEGLFDQAISAAAEVDATTEAATLTHAVIIGNVFAPPSRTAEQVARALELLPPLHPAREPLGFLGMYTELLQGNEPRADVLLPELQILSSDSHEDPLWAWTSTVYRLSALKLLELQDLAADLFTREFGRAVELGRPTLLVSLVLSWADHLLRLGRPAEAVGLATPILELSATATAPWTDLAFAVGLSELGRDEEAEPHLESLRSFLAGISTEYYANVWMWLGLMDARRALSSGRADAASQVMLDTADIAEHAGRRHPCEVPWAAVAIEAHLAAGHVDRARELVDDLERLSTSLSSRWPPAVVTLGRAQLAAAEGQYDQADRDFDRALELLGALPFAIDHAEALIAYGRYLRHSGRPRDARVPLRRGLELAEQASAERVARIARAELAATGGRRRRDPAERSDLTPQEQRVADLAAEGMSNPQIAAALHLSPKTIGHHLEHIYEKLGISSRRELIRRRSDPR